MFGLNRKKEDEKQARKPKKEDRRDAEGKKAEAKNAQAKNIGSKKTNAEISLSQDEIDVYTGKGFLYVRTIFELVGGPKEHVESTIRVYVDKLKGEREYKVVKVEYSDANEKDKLFQVFAEIEMLVKDASSLAFFCFDYMPSSIEIIQPEILHYRACDFAAFFNDLQHRLHTVDLALKELTAKNKNLLRTSNKLLRNIILLVIDAGGAKTLEELGNKIGISPDQIKDFLKQMVEDEWLREEKGLYHIGARREE